VPKVSTTPYPPGSTTTITVTPSVPVATTTYPAVPPKVTTVTPKVSTFGVPPVVSSYYAVPPKPSTATGTGYNAPSPSVPLVPEYTGAASSNKLSAAFLAGAVALAAMI
jgi:hypothetical protein